jgi:signal transduction histidine kinase/Flp pilus assembly protein TadD
LLTGINDSIAGDVLNYKEQLLANKGQYKEALQIGYKELAIRKKLSSRDAELNALLQIGYTYDRIGNYQKAINWYQKGLKMKGLKNEDYIGRNYGLIGIAYDELKDYEKAIFYNLQAISHFEKKPYSAFLHSWYSNIGNTYTKMGKLNLAEKYTLLALNDNKKKRYVTIINLGKIYIEKGNLSKAENVLKEVLADLQKKDQPAYLSEAYYRLHELFKKKNDFKTALFYYEKYKTTEDERLSIAKTKQFNELTVQYETVEKENTILQQKEKITENQLSLKSRNLWIFGLSLLAVIIGLIGFLLYKQQILKNIQQKNDNELKLAIEKIESQNRLQEQRLSISRDLHDNIGAQLSFIVSAIDTIKYYMTDKNNQTTNRLDNIAAFAKETIQELRDTIWAMNKSGITIKDLQSRIANFIEKAKQSHNNIQISLLIDSNVPVDKTFTGLQGLNIFRIIQEAISNALKYAESDQIDIHISKIVNDIHVIVKDNGKGFIENDLEAGNGLLNMRKRALELGDDLILISKKGIGTSISFNF